MVVPIKERTAAPSRALTPEERLMVESAQQIETTVEDLARIEAVSADMQPGDRGTVKYTGPGKVTVYKKTPLGYMPRSIPINNIVEAMKAGMVAECPDCHGQHSADLNACPTREKRHYRDCPVPGCNIDSRPKRIYDTWRPNTRESTKSNDPYLVQDDTFVASTPQERVNALLAAHMWAKHPTESRMMGLTPPPRVD